MNPRRARQRESWQIAVSDFGRIDRVAQALAYSQVARLGSSGAMTFRDPDVLHMTEAGLVVSYARPFMTTKPGDEGVRPYSQLPRDLVPPEHRDLHDLLVARRKQYVVHTGATDPPTRAVDDQSVAGWVAVSEPAHLSREHLVELSELCRKLRDKLQAKLDS